MCVEVTLVVGVGGVMPDGGGSLYAPSVDRLFASAAGAAGPGVLGVILTGMGDDGAQGARSVREAGGQIVAEAEVSCVVYGMPRALHEAGLAQADVPLDQMADFIRRSLHGR